MQRRYCDLCDLDCTDGFALVTVDVVKGEDVQEREVEICLNCADSVTSILGFSLPKKKSKGKKK